jgi:hypothetical protein|uniref:Uncharacterized protein n=1 Tax=viral metagenome TaxID=1070528 RepID=A0A6C0LYU3_9ZZZZ
MISLVLIGQMRTWNKPEIISSYEKYLSKYGTIDLYIFTWNKIGFSHRHGNHDLHPNSDDIITEAQIKLYYEQFKFINLKYVHIENFDTFINQLDDKILNIYNTPFLYHSQNTTSVPLQYKYQQAARYLFNIANEYKYSNMIISRPDMSFEDDLPEIDTKEEHIYYNCECVRNMAITWYGKPDTIIKQLYFAFDNFIEIHNILPSHNHLNKDINEILHFLCYKNNIKIIVNEKQMIRQICFS